MVPQIEVILVFELTPWLLMLGLSPGWAVKIYLGYQKTEI
jgi:hypothetical protein